MNEIKKVIEQECAPKYLQKGESFKEGMFRIANHLADDEAHREVLMGILVPQKFLPAGRIQSSAGALRSTTAFNCFVSDTIHDSMSSIMGRLADAAQTMRLGGGDGFDFSTLRPKGANIKTLDTFSSGPISFMEIWDSMCKTIRSAGHRRGAMMGVLRVDHPDIEEFITCKQQPGMLTNFNISVAVTDEFMNAVKNNLPFDLVFEGRVYKTVSAVALWNKIMRNTWDHAEPGVLFIDRINQKNNLNYCETIAATNPCGEQPLPPNGACLLGSFNLVKYVRMADIDAILDGGVEDDVWFDYEQFVKDIPPIVRMMDNVIDRTTYPLPDQEAEAKSKRRMGLGVTGVANAGEFLGHDYGSPEFVEWLEQVMSVLRDTAYEASSDLALEKGSFEFYDPEKYPNQPFIKTLSQRVQDKIRQQGIRNSHLLSVAPTGTISLWAGNISSGIEPVFQHEYLRRVRGGDVDGTINEYTIRDYAYDKWGLKGKTSDEVSAQGHIAVLNAASKMVDSACSKTCNVGDNVSFDEFKDLYMLAYDGGASGCTTFRPSGFRKGILEKKEESHLGAESLDNDVDGAACFIDPVTGERACSD